MALALSLGLVALGLRVVVEGTCPSEAAVEAQLQPMLPSDQPSGLRAYIEPLDELLRIEVRNENGVLLTVRDLQRTSSCGALAVAAAVVITSAIASLPRPPAPELAPPPPPPPPPPLPRRPPRLLWEVGAAGALALSNQAVTGGGSLYADLAPLGGRLQGRLGLRIEATATGRRSEPLADGSADYTRLHLMLGARYRFRKGETASPFSERLLLEASAGVLGALVLVDGNGFARNYNSLGADVGLAAGLRVGQMWPRMALWIELLGIGWLRPQEVVLVDTVSSRLPAWDILLRGGIGFGHLR